MIYEPKPIDTSEIQLEEDILELTEFLAKNIHDIWALQRIKQGWKPGEKRDDNKKEHPCLVPYDELPEEEKIYDRMTTLEAIKVIIALGYKIHR